jgi:uncharacterized protein YbdZ (MbtH family)
MCAAAAEATFRDTPAVRVQFCVLRRSAGVMRRTAGHKLRTNPTEGSMRARASSHEIIVSTDNVYVVWPAGRAVPSGWHYIGKGGTEAELATYLREMFVETLPAPMLVARGDQPESRWA